MKISVIGYKGGVGKTTIAEYITNRLKENYYKVKLINSD
ncbi:AAA family ATPase [Acidianus manzaensis]|nr:AAA family ATPase [Acidianus manzaensis]